MQHRLRVLVVDDAVVIRKVLTEILSADPHLEVVGTAANGRIAMAKIAQLRPDVVTLDVEMPEMDGIETLKAIRATDRRLPVIMFSTVTERGAAKTMEALLAGANDYVTKPANVGSITVAMERVSEDLIPRIKALCKFEPAASTPGRVVGGNPSTNTAPARTTASPARVDVIAIGVSTGGPNALVEVLPALPADLPVPVLVVQHMPPRFTHYLAERLNGHCALNVAEAAGGEVLRPGQIWIAPGGSHLMVRQEAGTIRLRTNEEPPENSCRPAVDVLFRSVAATFGPHALGVVMTGMGYDGRRGARDLVDAGSRVIVQDEASSVVWGMPGAVAAAGLAERVLPLSGLAAEMDSRARTLRSPQVAAGAGR